MGRRQFSSRERLFGVKCATCGVRERERDKVQNHHINGNKYDNRRENMAWLCLKHHRFISKSQQTGRPAKLPPAKSRGAEPVCERKAGGSKSLSRSGTDPKRTSSEERGDEILKGLLRYLNEEALPRGESRDEILVNAGPFINRVNPPSEPALRRRLKMFTESRYYPFKFDDHDVIYMDLAEPVPIEKQESE